MCAQELVPSAIKQERARPLIEGCKIIAKFVDKEGLEHSRIHITPGSYEAQIGFRQFGRFESDWFSAATDNQGAQERPFEIDAQNPDVVRFAEQFFLALQTIPDDEGFMSQLDIVYSAMLPSASISKYEHYDRLSDIVREGNGTCAAKTLLLGTILSRQYPHLQLQEIYGQVGVVKDRVSYPFGHQWLRVESKKYVFLYDSMYSRIACFEKYGKGLVPKGDGHKTLTNYSVEAWPVAALYNRIGFSSVSENVKLVETYDETSHQFFLTPESGLEAQADGTVWFSFSTEKDSILELVNGNIQTKMSGGAGLYYPVESLVRNS